MGLIQRLGFGGVIALALLSWLPIQEPLIHALINRNKFTLLTRVPNNTFNKNKLTIIIPTHHERVDIVTKNIMHILNSNFSFVDHIFLYWNDFNRSQALPDSYYDMELIYPRFSVIDTVDRDLSARFLIPSSIRTRTVLSLDDDIVFDMSEMNKTFYIYQSMNFSDRVAGPVTRTCEKTHYVFGSYDNYNMILTGFSILDLKFMEYYHSSKYQLQREMVASMNNCEDMLMNFIVTAETRKPPVNLDIKLQGVSKAGISSHPNHVARRNKCCQVLGEQFKDRYLIKNTDVYK